ncbi:MAG TPA: hypothetical protein VNZ52_15500 [Candidatus Thermoplasmatota archaeon]|nr:hypothetical protein [Candidatus Thermoplasmatota archaeon]
MPPKVDPKARLEQERARIRRRERTLELSLLGVLVSLTVFPFLFAKLTDDSLVAFIASMVFMVAFIGVAAWAAWDRKKALRDL